jgi:hypothetical protein
MEFNYTSFVMKPISVFLLLSLVAFPFFAVSEEPRIHFPNVGGELFYVDDPEDFVGFYQLIPISNGEVKEKFVSYLATILRDENATVLGGATILETIVTFITFDTENLTYAFISSKSNNLIVKEPYKVSGSDDVWFEMKTIKDDKNEFVSLWLFKRKREDDFRLHLDIPEVVRLEMGRYTLLPEIFKKGERYEKVHDQFRIIAFGEYYAEPFIQELPQETEEFTTVDFKAYTDTIAITLGTQFGFRFELFDEEKEGSYTFLMEHPPYKTGPKKDETEFVEEKECAANRVDDIVWEFQNEYELVPGKWSIKLLDGNKTIYKKDFHLTIK